MGSHCTHCNSCPRNIFGSRRKFACLRRQLLKQEITYVDKFLRIVSGSSWYNDRNVWIPFQHSRFWFAQMAIRLQLLSVPWLYYVHLGSGINFRFSTRIYQSILLRRKAWQIPSLLHQKENYFVDRCCMGVYIFLDDDIFYNACCIQVVSSLFILPHYNLWYACGEDYLFVVWMLVYPTSVDNNILLR